MNERIFCCDTNILRELVEHPEKWPAFYEHLSETRALLVVSLIQLIELKKTQHHHEGISKLLLGTRSAIFKWWKFILNEEAKLYPATSEFDPVLRPILSDSLHGTSSQVDLPALLDGYEIGLMWQVMEETKQPYMNVMSWLPNTAPKPAADANLDFTLHNYGFVLSELREDNQSFIDAYKKRLDEFKPELFRGSYLRAAYIYYRYILKSMSPQPSDIGDLHQVFYAPYSNEVVLEKSMAGILHQIRKEKNLLRDTRIRSIRFIRDLSSN